MTDAEILDKLLLTLARYGYRATSVKLQSGATFELMPALETLSPGEKRTSEPDDSPGARNVRDLGLTGFNG